MDNGGQIQSASDFESSPTGLQQRWSIEISAAKKDVRKWHEIGRRLVDRFLDKRKGQEDGDTRLNLFSANLQTQRAMMLGKTPRVDVTRRFEDSNDAIARCAATMLERLLNTDIEEDADDYVSSLAMSLDDRLLVGLGNVRLRYEAEFEDQEEVPAQTDDQGNELAPAYTPEPLKASEGVKVDYVHWRDQLWSPARTWGEVRWWAFRVYMTQDQLKERFGKTVAENVPLSTKQGKDRSEVQKNDPWARAEVWEIWSKEDKRVYWYVEGAVSILDAKDDPLELEGFFPCPKPMVANLTTDAFMPRPDFILAQDLYNEIDYVSTRITLLERAVKVVGVYDKTAEGVRRLLTEGFDNDLIGVDNWAMFAERGGLKGQIDWLPLEQVVAALDKLRDYRQELIKLTFEITGMSDIMRGEQQANETATTSALKAKFASVRLQSAQDEFARFASDILKIKSEIIVKHCDDEFILNGSNIAFTVDAQLAQPAIQLLRNEASKYRIEVKPENVAMTDFDVLKAERTAYLQGLTTFLQATAPMIQAQPAAGPFLLELLKWGLAGFRGSSTIEAVVDQAIAEMKQQLAQPKPPQGVPPEVQAQQAKAQSEIQVAKVKAATQIDTLQKKHQIDQQRLQLDAQRAQLDLQKMAAEARLKAVADLHAQVSPPPGGSQP